MIRPGEAFVDMKFPEESRQRTPIVRNQDSRRLCRPLQHQSIRNTMELQCLSYLKVDCRIESSCCYYDSLIEIVVGLKPKLHERAVGVSSNMASNLRWASEYSARLRCRNAS